MTTLTITLDDSPEAQLIIQLLRQASVVTSVREDSSAEAAESLPPIRCGKQSRRPHRAIRHLEGPAADIGRNSAAQLGWAQSKRMGSIAG